MRKRNSLVVFTIMTLTLFSVSQALGQAPIEGWDKAKFGMSPEEVRSAYQEEEIYIPGFWVTGEQRERWRPQSPNDADHPSRPSYPQILIIENIEVLGENPHLIWFFFVLNRLFKVEFRFTGASEIYRRIDEVQKSQDLLGKIEELKTFLVKKYGSASETEVAQKNENDKWTKNAVWVDTTGNSLTLRMDFKRIEIEDNEYQILTYVNVIYLDTNLEELWEEKRSTLGIVGEESF